MVNILGGPAEGALDERFAAAMAAHPACEDPHLRQGAAARPQGRPRQRRRATTSTTSPTRRGPRHPTSPTERARASSAIGRRARVVAGIFQPRALAWSGDPAAALLRRAPGRRRHGLRLRLARHERRLAGPHRLRHRRTRSRSSRPTARPTSSSATGARRAARGLRAIIAGAGGAAHLPGMLASVTALPVIGVPVQLATLDGLDSLLSIVQMPAGIPVATVSINGAKNAGLLAVRILGVVGRRRSPTRIEDVRPRPRGAGRGEEPAAQGVAVSVASPPRPHAPRAAAAAARRGAPAALPRHRLARGHDPARLVARPPELPASRVRRRPLAGNRRLGAHRPRRDARDVGRS